MLQYYFTFTIFNILTTKIRKKLYKDMFTLFNKGFPINIQFPIKPIKEIVLIILLPLTISQITKKKFYLQQVVRQY